MSDERKQRDHSETTGGCPDNPALQLPTILILMTGQLLILAKQNGEDFVTVGVPDFGDEHYLAIKIYELQIAEDISKSLITTRGGPMQSDLWLDVPQPDGLRFSYEKIANDPSELKSDNCNQDFDIQWLANFEASNYHNRQLVYDTTFMQRSVRLTSGHFYTAMKSPKPFPVVQGGLAAGSNRYTASIIGVNINLKANSTATLQFEDDPDHPLSTFKSGNHYIITIENNPPICLGTNKSDFSKYYKVVKNIRPSLRFDLTSTPDANATCYDDDNKTTIQASDRAADHWLIDLIKLLATEDVPCVPGGGGFPPPGS